VGSEARRWVWSAKHGKHYGGPAARAALIRLRGSFLSACAHLRGSTTSRRQPLRGIGADALSMHGTDAPLACVGGTTKRCHRQVRPPGMSMAHGGIEAASCASFCLFYITMSTHAWRCTKQPCGACPRQLLSDVLTELLASSIQADDCQCRAWQQSTIAVMPLEIIIGVLTSVWKRTT
jgi:hypothetical protein